MKFLPEARHMYSEGLRSDINNNLSERFQGTFRSRTKTLRGMDSRKTGQHYLDGWVLTYNNFRGHESLRNKTPAYRAKVDPPFKEWADVVKAEAAPRKSPRVRPASQSTPKPRLPRRTADHPEPGDSGKGKEATGFKTPEAGISKSGEGQGQEKTTPPWARHIPRLPSKN